LTKVSLYVYFGHVAVLVCRRFDHTPPRANKTAAVSSWELLDHSLTNHLAVSQLADWSTRGLYKYSKLAETFDLKFTVYNCVICCGLLHWTLLIVDSIKVSVRFRFSVHISTTINFIIIILLLLLFATMWWWIKIITSNSI